MTPLVESQNLLSLFLENLRSEESRRVVAQHLQEEQLLEPEADFGGEVSGTALSRSVQAARANEPALRRALGGATVELSSIYENRQQKVGKIFTLCLFAVGLFVLLLAGGLVVAFWQESAGKMGMLTTAGSLVPGFLAATAFFIYKKESAGLTTIESEITKMKKLEAYFEWSRNISDEQTLNEAYKSLMAQMKV